MGRKIKILVIDAQGGGIGKQLITQLRQDMPELYIMAVGSNSTASMNMLKAGADEAAAGENPVVVGCRTADIIVGPVGIVIADSMLGEITPKMAAAVAQSSAKRILIPFNQCGNVVVGVSNMSISALVKAAAEEIRKEVSASLS